ncbi:hypothetical protein [Poriferisphaera sp. WC338]|uniref:hypothetical protein n=1 Tax=Poriferisphaera sp. WC338 TaxID=3425129 RepID=UPI003D819AA8
MFPNFKQRILIICSASIGAFILIFAAHALMPKDASTGIVLLNANLGLLPALFSLLIYAIPAIVLALLCSAAGHPYAGLLVASFSLLVLAAAGGSPEGFIWSIESPQQYLTLIFETLIWLALFIAFLFAIHITRPTLRKKLEHVPSLQTHAPDFNLFVNFNSNAIIALLLSAGIAGFLTNNLILSTATAQSTCSLILAFGLAAFLTKLIIPKTNPLAIFLSPFLVAIVAYALIRFNATSYPTMTALYIKLYQQDFPGMAIALPIQYASAAVFGSVLGYSAGSSMDAAFTHENDADPATT